MKAKLLPLEGKYYNTKILIEYNNGTSDTIAISASSNFDPSDREIERCGFTKEEWENNIVVDDGWGGKMNLQDGELFDGVHSEKQQTYLNALEIVKKLNK